jgi:hypothetical protein
MQLEWASASRIGRNRILVGSYTIGPDNSEELEHKIRTNNKKKRRRGSEGSNVIK